MQLIFAFPDTRKDDFSTFVTDRNNQAAVALCQSFCDDQPVGGKGSLVLYGPSGGGKTHLLTAIGAGRPGALYLDGATLAERVMTSQTYAELKTYLRQFAGAPLLAVDHIETVEGNLAMEEQLFHLYNAVTQRDGFFLAATNRPPGSWRFNDHLKTRLLWGQVVELRPVGDDARGEVLVKMAADQGMALPQSAARWLLTRLPRDPVSQGATLARINRYSLKVGSKVSLPLIKKALEEAE